MHTNKLVVLLLGAAACLEPGGPSSSSTSILIGGCGLDCTTNSPIVWGLPFNEISLDGVSANAQGATLVSATDVEDIPIELRSVGDVLESKRPGKDWQTLAAGATITIAHPDAKDGQVDIHIVEVAQTPHWVKPAGEPATAYRIKANEGGELRDICPRAVDEQGFPDVPDFHVFVFGSDRYDHATRRIRPSDTEGNWLNFACEGGAIAKLHLTRHTDASATDDNITSHRERQTLLKMFGADYCDDGSSNTVVGHPLRYTDRKGWFEEFYVGEFDVGIASIEAVWNANGAACLSEPRLDSLAFEDILCDEKPIPTCSPDVYESDDWKKMGTIISANPL